MAIPRKKRQEPWRFNTGSQLNDNGVQARGKNPSDKDCEDMIRQGFEDGTREAAGDTEARDGEV